MSREVKLQDQQSLLAELHNKCDSLFQSRFLRSSVESSVNALLEEHIALRQELKVICDLQKQLVKEKPLKTDRKGAVGAFIKWCDRMQIERRGVDITYSDEIGFELQTTEPIGEGVNMINVPRNALFSWDQARKSVLLRKCFERDVIVRTMDNVALALMLCCQKLSPDSYWHPYFDILPESFDTPLYFTLEELQSLRPSPAFEESLLLFRNVTRQFLYFFLEVFRATEYQSAKKKQHMQMEEPTFLNSPLTPYNFTFDLYRWSVTCVSTRVNMIPSQDLKDKNGDPLMVIFSDENKFNLDGPDGFHWYWREPMYFSLCIFIPCLIPFLDMANHEVELNTSPPSVYFSVENDCASITSARKYDALQTVRIYYGRRSSSDFLLHNGFVPNNDNPDDTCKLKIGLPKKSEFYEARLKMMQDYGYSTNSNIFYFTLSLSEPSIDEPLFYFSRVFVLEKPGDGQEKQLENMNVVYKAWDFLRKRLELTIGSYGNLEKFEPKSSRQANILKLKQNEVKIFQKAFSYCNAQIDKVKQNNSM